MKTWSLCFVFVAILTVLQLNAVFAQNKQKFKVFNDTDIPGYDYRSSQNDKSLRNISSKGCIKACAKDNRCRAFTYNKKAKVCFLKTVGLKRKKFRGALSGIKVGKQGQLNLAGPDFQIMQSIDIPGFDYRSPKNDPTLYNTGLKGCMHACQQDQVCMAFTYNTVANWCFLKKGFKRTKRFNIAISGIKKKASADTKIISHAKKTLDEWPPSVSKIREAAVKYGGSCDVETKQIDRLSDKIKVRSKKGRYEVGQDITIKWEAKQHNITIPLYLIISIDQPVRFSGNGFYPLLPEAQAAFGIEWNRDHTRAIIPLYGSGAAPVGQLQILPLVAEALKAEWAIVGYVRKCKQEIAKSLGKVKYKIQPGQKFSVVLNEPASLIKPEKIYSSPNGKTQLEVFKKSFRLIDAKSGALIFEGAGTEPNYSPTGRFITVHTEDKLDVIDTIDGKPLHKGGSHMGGDIGWQNKDSYLITGGIGSGQQYKHFSIHRSLKYGNWDGCRICRGLVGGYTLFNLENNLAIIKGFNSVQIFNLSSKDKIYEASISQNRNDVHNMKSAVRRALSSIDQNQIYASFHNPSIDVILSKIQFSKVLSGYSSIGPGSWLDNRNNLIANSLIKPNKITPIGVGGKNFHYANNGSGKIVRTTAWRSLDKLKKATSFEFISERLSEVSVKLMPKEQPRFLRNAGGMTKEYQREKPISEKEINEIIKQIYLDIPRSKGAFTEKYTEYACHSDNMTDLVRRFEQVVKYETRGKKIWITHNTCIEGSGAFNSPTLTIFSKDLKNGFQRLNLRENSNNIATGCVSIDYCDLKIELVSDKYIAFWTSESGGIALYDIVKNKVIFKKYNLKNGELIEHVALLEDQKHLIQINSDNSFYIYRITNQKQLLEGRIADEEAIVWASSGHYDATPEGAHYVSLKFPGRYGQYSFQQFERQLFSKEFVKRVLAKKQLPKITLTSPPSLKAAFRLEGQDQVKINVVSNAISNGAKLNIYQDGILSNQFEYETGKDADYSFKRLPGARWVSAVIMNQQGLVSLPVGSDLGSYQSRKNKLHYLTVGINKYEKANDLSFGVSDAKNLAKALGKNKGMSYELGETSTLHNEAASATAIIEQLSKIVASAQIGDTIVFSFAGHGVRDEKGRFYLGTSTIDPNKINETGLLWDDVVKLFKGSKARIAVFLDACHSGAAGTDASIYATNDQVVSGLLAGMPPGLVVFSASKGRELSEEDGKRGGVFTNALTDVITHQRSKFDTNKNGSIEISELYNGVKKQVVKNARGKQTPWLARNQMVGDFALF